MSTKTKLTCLGLFLAMATFQAGAQEANDRAGWHFGIQLTWSTAFNNNERVPNVKGGSLYLEKIWKSNNALRARLEYMDTGDFTFIGHGWQGDEIPEAGRITYKGLVIDFIRYFDNKFVPYVITGIGIYDLYRKHGRSYYSGLPDETPVSGAFYAGVGWEFSKWGAVEFKVRGHSETSQTFEVSLCLKSSKFFQNTN
jgi:hypothetical protein